MDRVLGVVSVVLLGLGLLTQRALCAPTSSSSSSSVENAAEGQNHTQPATCMVAGTEYSHGYQIPRADPCELCLCLDGELFCWWQDCPSASPACRESPAYAACADNSTMQLSPLEETATEGTSEAVALMTSEAAPPENTSSNALVSTSGIVTTSSSSSSAENNNSPAAAAAQAATENPQQGTTPTVCRVMGTEYKIGEVLPRDTGTCLECVCDSEARVTCSPKDCASHDEFHSANNLDMFDVDTF